MEKFHEGFELPMKFHGLWNTYEAATKVETITHSNIVTLTSFPGHTQLSTEDTLEIQVFGPL